MYSANKTKRVHKLCSVHCRTFFSYSRTTRHPSTSTANNINITRTQSPASSTAFNSYQPPQLQIALPLLYLAANLLLDMTVHPQCDVE